MIDTTQLSFRYSRSSDLALQNVDLSLCTQAVAVLGPNGAGKSTLFSLLTGQRRPLSGSFTSSNWTSDDRKGRSDYLRKISFVPQDLQFSKNYTVSEVLRYVGWLKEVAASSLDQNCSFALASVNLTDAASRRVKTLSGGMQRRLALATGLVNRPSILFLDEPTVGLDPFQRSEFRALLRRIKGTCTVVIASHLTDDVASLADEVVVLDGGRALFCGSLCEFVGAADREAITGHDVEAAYLARTRTPS